MSTSETKVLDECIASAISECARGIGLAVVAGRRTCVHCEHFAYEIEGCQLANGARPPAKVIAFGCQAFEPAIPF